MGGSLSKLGNDRRLICVVLKSGELAAARPEA
jgi:hypothetical protein